MENKSTGVGFGLALGSPGDHRESGVLNTGRCCIALPHRVSLCAVFSPWVSNFYITWLDTRVIRVSFFSFGMSTYFLL